jgi:hypothetical protein
MYEAELGADRAGSDLCDAARTVLTVDPAVTADQRAFAAARLVQHCYETKQAAPPSPARVSFRKNVEIAPFKHEHAEVSVDVNGGSFADALQLAKDLVDEALGVKELRTAQQQIDAAKEVLRKAARARRAQKRPFHDPALEDALRWGNYPADDE